ncbi:MAG: PAS domain-containing sensor histidine kinase [Phyllobacteriaceae bacterium]|nr:PAS domain-containing sensor histidine kinase [Phyllobacteriaceae bacterium]MBA89839.1 PAS domain-containing sensor histidine kinase [Phyllobacteriaceae bacterium]
MTKDRDGMTPGEGRRLLALPGVLTVVAALLVAVVSFVILMGLTPIRPDETTTLVLIGINAALVLTLIVLILREARRIIQARRVGKAASRLHVRIVALFSLVAAVPAIMVAIVASITLDAGLDRWFEIRTRAIINSSLSIAEAYIRENAGSLQGTTLSMAGDLDQNRLLFSLDKGGFRKYLSDQANGRALAHAALINAQGAFVMTAETAADFPMPEPFPEVIDQAQDGRPVLIPPRFRNLVGCVVKLRELEDGDLFLYTVRVVDPEVIKARQIVAANVAEYQGLANNRTSTQVAFALLYLGVTLVVVLSAIWTGIAVADRLVRPIRQLIGAADEVSTGNLDVRVPVRLSDGDVASLGDTFNKMLAQLKSQRNELLSAKDQIDERRRFSEAVLSGVTAGVIGVQFDGSISLVNRSGEQMLGVLSADVEGKNLSEILPHIGQVFEIARNSGRPVWREQTAFYRNGMERTFNVQITVEDSDDEDHAYVVTVDDITDLVTAQRTSAWADVARRIAHEIKNPLTPIQLSAERIRRRYGKVITEDREVFDQCTDTIIRQVGDIGRMVDEFSAFARMPKPSMEETDLREALREGSFLVEVSRSEIAFERAFMDTPLPGRFDNRLMAQAVGNLVKNAAESIDGAMVDDPSLKGVIRIAAKVENGRIVVDVIDNGRGLPRDNRQRLLEPYMTTREKGTGLGLAIVRKIIEDHGGTLSLHDAPASFHGGRGAMIRIILPAAGASGARTREGAQTQQEEDRKVDHGV